MADRLQGQLSHAHTLEASSPVMLPSLSALPCRPGDVQEQLSSSHGPIEANSPVATTTASFIDPLLVPVYATSSVPPFTGLVHRGKLPFPVPGN